jgi:hypothetical protein
LYEKKGQNFGTGLGALCYDVAGIDRDVLPANGIDVVSEWCDEARSIFEAIFDESPPGCSTGYAGDDCAECQSIEAAKFFRKGSLCQPCPSNVLGPLTLLVLAFLTFVGALVFVSYFAGKIVTKAQVLNQLTTPLIILVTFGQTLSVVVDIDLKWPSFLLEIFSWFSFLSLKCVFLSFTVFSPATVRPVN